METKSILDQVLLNETMFEEGKVVSVIMRETNEDIGKIETVKNSFIAKVNNGKRTFPCATMEFAITALIGLNKQAKKNLKKNKKNINLKQENLFA